MKNNMQKTGFTLVELLVVIGVIGILSGIVYASFADARAAARDGIRKTDLKQLQLAVEMYKAQHGQYPASGCAANWSGHPPAITSDWSLCEAEEYIDGLVPDFISSLPIDPLPDRNTRVYIYRTDGTSYKIMSHTAAEVELITSFDDEFARCPEVVTGQSADGYCGSNGPQQRTYAVYGGPNSAGW